MNRINFLYRRFRSRPSRLIDFLRNRLSAWLCPRYRRSRIRLLIGTPTSVALGDNLLLTTVAREVKKRNPSAQIEVITNVPDVFDRNPDIDLVSPRCSEKKSTVQETVISYSYGFPYRKHFLEYCCACINISDAIELRTYIYPSPEDHAWADTFVSKLSSPPVLIHRSGGSKIFRKTWPLEHWTELAMRLRRHSSVVDVGVNSDPLFNEDNTYRSVIGETSVHRLAALMARSRALISVDSGPVHLAAAQDLSTVCILGGVYPSEGIRYPRSIVVTDRPSCSDCWPLRHCDFDAQCINDIKVDIVLAALDNVCPELRGHQFPGDAR